MVDPTMLNEKENKSFRYGKDKDNLVIDVVRYIEFFNIWMSSSRKDIAPLIRSNV